jgi:uncharacterized protein
MTPVLLDTGVIVALLDRSARDHQRSVEVVEAVRGGLVTCEAVITESCYLLRHQPGASDVIIQNVERGTFKIQMDLERSAVLVRTLMKRYARVPMDFADACLVAMADEQGTGSILTLDADFRVYRWRRSRPFEMLLEV